MSKKFYCGDRDDIPDKYNRRGSRLECLRKGIGTGMYLKEKELGIAKVPIVFENEDEDEREMRLSREEKIDERRGERDEDYEDKDKYQKFMEENFDKAKRTARNLEIGDVFKQLAIMWKLENKIKKSKKKKEKDGDEDYEDY